MGPGPTVVGPGPITEVLKQCKFGGDEENESGSGGSNDYSQQILKEQEMGQRPTSSGPQSHH